MVGFAHVANPCGTGSGRNGLPNRWNSGGSSAWENVLRSTRSWSSSTPTCCGSATPTNSWTTFATCSKSYPIYIDQPQRPCSSISGRQPTRFIIEHSVASCSARTSAALVVRSGARQTVANVAEKVPSTSGTSISWRRTRLPASGRVQDAGSLPLEFWRRFVSETRCASIPTSARP